MIAQYTHSVDLPSISISSRSKICSVKKWIYVNAVLLFSNNLQSLFLIFLSGLIFCQYIMGSAAENGSLTQCESHNDRNRLRIFKSRTYINERNSFRIAIATTIGRFQKRDDTLYFNTRTFRGRI